MLKLLFGTILLFFFVGFRGEGDPSPYPFPKLWFFPPMPSAAENSVTVEGVRLGRFLFYDEILSENNNISCSSCHRQEAAFSDAPKQFSATNDGGRTKRNSMGLFNLAWYPSLFWDGRAASIEEQVFHPLRTKDEMNLGWQAAGDRVKKKKLYPALFKAAFGSPKIDSVQISKAIGQFLRSLLSYESKYDKVLRGDAYFTKDEKEGLVIVNDQTKGDCLHCHSTDADALGTVAVFSNNGLDTFTNALAYKDKGLGMVTGKVSDYGRFMVPSLRNLVFTAPYMHDGRFKTLEEVIDFYSEGVNSCANIDSKMQYAHQRGVRLNKLEKKQVLAFLRTLSDSSFVSKKEYGNPFKKNNQH